jgi:hypothetical protein
MIIKIKTSLGETSIRFISHHDHANLGCHSFDTYENNR